MATLYRKQGFSYSEIAALCDVSKSTVSNWFKDKAFSKKITTANAEKAAKANKARIALLNKAKQNERQKHYKEAERSAVVEWRNYKSNPLFIAGLMLYASSGDTSDEQRIRFSDGRIEQHKIFQRFLIRFLGVEKRDIRFWLLLYPDQNATDCVAAWSKALKFTPDNFYKNQTIKGRSTKSALQFGVGNTIIGNTLLKKKLSRWIELLLKEVSK